MICEKVKECAEKAKHVPPQEKTKKKNTAHNKQKKDIYQYPLTKSPCRSDECQRRCIAFLDTRQQAKCDDKGKSYILDQSDQFPRYEILKLCIDKGVITDPEAGTVNKCDYALLIRDAITDKRGTAILVELKGKDIRHALKQLRETLDQKELSALWNSQRRMFGRIVCKSAPPRIQNTDEFMDVKEAFFDRHGNIKIGEEYMKEEYAKLEK